MSFRKLSISFALFLILLANGCNSQSYLSITEFSDNPVVISAGFRVTSIVRIKFSTQGNLSSGVKMIIADGEQVIRSVLIPKSGDFDSGLMDWYSTKANISFADSAGVSGTLKLTYKFIPLLMF